MARTIHLMLLTLKAEKSILTTTSFPIFPTLLSRLGEVLHDTGIRFIALVFIVIWYQIDINFTSVVLSMLSHTSYYICSRTWNDVEHFRCCGARHKKTCINRTVLWAFYFFCYFSIPLIWYTWDHKPI